MKFDSFTGTADSFPSLNIGAARTVNWTQEPTSEKSAFALVRTPGLSLFVTLPKSPCRGIFPGDGALYAVGADHLYRIRWTAPLSTAPRPDSRALPVSARPAARSATTAIRSSSQ